MSLLDMMETCGDFDQNYTSLYLASARLAAKLSILSYHYFSLLIYFSLEGLRDFFSLLFDPFSSFLWLKACSISLLLRVNEARYSFLASVCSECNLLIASKS